MKAKTSQRAALAVFRSWQTTLAGFLAFVTATAPQWQTLLDNDTATQPNWNIIAGALLVFLGLAASRDSGVSSQEAGAR